MVKTKFTKDLKLSILFKLMYISLFCGIIVPFAIRVISEALNSVYPMLTIYVAGLYICLGIISYIASFILIISIVMGYWGRNG